MIVVVDIETTGLEPNDNLILELGMIITDDNFNLLTSFNKICHYSKEDLSDINPIDPIVQEMHEASGLWTLVRGQQSIELEDVEEAAVRFLNEFNATGNPMCGSSVHFDRAFIKLCMPKLNNLFHYRNIDVSTVKNLCEKWNPEVFEKRPEGRKVHRVIFDCIDTIAELRYYKENFLNAT